MSPLTSLHLSVCNEGLVMCILSGQGKYIFFSSFQHLKLNNNVFFLFNISHTALANASYPGLMLVNVTPSTLFLRCPEGMVPHEAVEAGCEEDGKWDPNPDDHQCTSGIFMD